MAVLAYASASSSCIEVCSPTSVFHVRSFTAPVSAALRPLLQSAAPSQHLTMLIARGRTARLPRVIRATFTAYIRRIYVPTFRMVSGFEFHGPLAQWDRLYPLPVRRTAVLLTASFRFHLAMDTLAVRLAVPTIRACSGTCTAKSTKWPPQPLRSRLRATRHAGRTTESDSRVREPRLFCCRTAFWRGTASESSSEYAGTTLFSGSFGRCHSRWSYIAA